MQPGDPPRDEAGFKLDELAKEAGVSPRTVRYYVQRGLLPAPAFRGRDTTYGPEHLVRLRAVKRLQERYWPLDRIETALAGRTLEEIERLAREDAAGSVPFTSTSPAPPPLHPPAGAPGPPVPPPSRRETPRRETWTRTSLRPGLALELRADADDTARTWARRIEELVERWAREDRDPHGSTR